MVALGLLVSTHPACVSLIHQCVTVIKCRLSKSFEERDINIEVQKRRFTLLQLRV